MDVPDEAGAFARGAIEVVQLGGPVAPLERAEDAVRVHDDVVDPAFEDDEGRKAAEL